jgi:hypothetical protein
MLDQNDNLRHADGKQELDSSVHPESNLQDVISNINNSNAEDSENYDNKDLEIEFKEYETLNLSTLVEELDYLLTEYPIASIKNHVEEIRKVFTNKYNQLIDEKRDEYINENGNDLGFEYYLSSKNKFDGLMNKYKDRKNTHYNNLQNQLKVNLKNREKLLYDLKQLLDSNTEDAKTLVIKVNEIKERWRNAGPVPKDKYNLVFNDYQFHMERFFEHLNMDREMREVEFQHNFEQKSKIIERVKELLKERDVIKSFKELQTLHRIWKEEIGPVAKDKSDELWNELSELTKKLHDKREEFFKDQKHSQIVNLSKRKAIIANIQVIANEKIDTHSDWQTQINRVEVLREAFINAGRVPTENNEGIWDEFKQIVKYFNANKNNFYKTIKKDQQNNLNKKIALLEKAKQYMHSEDYATATPIMKQIQEQWRNIGHVPKKYSDDIWKEFKESCNYYFDRLAKVSSEKVNSENEIYEQKKQYLTQLKTFTLTGDHKQNLQAIKQHIQNWKDIGKVGPNKRHIESKFNKVLDYLFDQLTIGKKDMELEKFNTKIDQIVANKDNRQLTAEIITIQRKLDEIQNEIFQLENNIQFITNAKKDNPLIKEINKNIDKLHEDLNIWKEKLNILRDITI